MTEQCRQRLKEQIPKLPDNDVMWLRKFCEAVLIKRELEWEKIPMSKLEEALNGN